MHFEVTTDDTVLYMPTFIECAVMDLGLRSQSLSWSQN